MPQYLIVLISILVVIAIIVLIYFLWFIRRSMNVVKKVDYLIEDITFKSESLKVVFDAAISLSTYFNSLENIINDNINNLVNLFNTNNKEVADIVQNIKEIINNAKKTNITKNKRITAKKINEK